MSRYQLEEYYQLLDARTDLDNRKISIKSCQIGANAIQSLFNIMFMIDSVDDDVRFTAKEIFDTLYK